MIPVAASKPTLDPDCYFRTTVDPVDGKMALRASNNLYLSRINYGGDGGAGGMNPIEAIKPAIDPFSKFAVVSPRWSGV